jgi:hypothetical protein
MVMLRGLVNRCSNNGSAGDCHQDAVVPVVLQILQLAFNGLGLIIDERRYRVMTFKAERSGQ